MGVWVYSYLSRKTITRLISLLSCVMRPPACENNYVNYFFFQHDIDNNNYCNYAMYCCNIAVCRSEAVATLYYTCMRTHTHTHTHTRTHTHTHAHTHTHTHSRANTQIKHLTNQNDIIISQLVANKYLNDVIKRLSTYSFSLFFCRCARAHSNHARNQFEYMLCVCVCVCACVCVCP